MSDLYMSYKILEANEMHFKTCTKCGETLPATTEYFHKDKNGKYGLKSTCKKCRAEYHKQHYEDNKDKIKQYYEDNKDKHSNYMKQWYENNKDKVRKRGKQYRSTVQGQIVKFNSSCKRRTKEQNQGNGITKYQWLEMMKYFEFRCAYSGEVLNENTRSIDHIEPLNQGGEHEIWNVVPMYRSYNLSKHDKDMLQWYKEQPYYSEERLQKIYEWQEYAYNKYSKK